MLKKCSTNNENEQGIKITEVDFTGDIANSIEEFQAFVNTIKQVEKEYMDTINATKAN